MCEYTHIMHKKPQATQKSQKRHAATSDQVRAIDVVPMQLLPDILSRASTPGSDITI